MIIRGRKSYPIYKYANRSAANYISNRTLWLLVDINGEKSVIGRVDDCGYVLGDNFFGEWFYVVWPVTGKKYQPISYTVWPSLLTAIEKEKLGLI